MPKVCSLCFRPTLKSLTQVLVRKQRYLQSKPCKQRLLYNLRYRFNITIAASHAMWQHVDSYTLNIFYFSDDPRALQGPLFIGRHPWRHLRLFLSAASALAIRCCPASACKVRLTDSQCRYTQRMGRRERKNNIRCEKCGQRRRRSETFRRAWAWCAY